MIRSKPAGDYRAIDSGDGRKLEAVGPYVLDRPEASAEHPSSLTSKRWQELRHARYEEGEKGTGGEWQLLTKMPLEWNVELLTEQLTLKAHCRIGDSKHYGFFPEQAVNWDKLYQELRKAQGPKALLLFAYTGMASLACRAAGADTFHVEASKATLTRARENMELNGLSDIRWVLEDAMKFARRETRRKRRYHAIVLDPPSFGRGPDGELWKADERTVELLETCLQLLDPRTHLLIMNLYSELSPIKELREKAAHFCEKNDALFSIHDLYIPSEEGHGIRAGSCLRIEKKA